MVFKTTNLFNHSTALRFFFFFSGDLPDYYCVYSGNQYIIVASFPGSLIFSTHAQEKRGSLGSNVKCVTWAHILG